VFRVAILLLSIFLVSTSIVFAADAGETIINLDGTETSVDTVSQSKNTTSADSQEQCDKETGKGCNVCGTVTYPSASGDLIVCSKPPANGCTPKADLKICSLGDIKTAQTELSKCLSSGEQFCNIRVTEKGVFVSEQLAQKELANIESTVGQYEKDVISGAFSEDGYQLKAPPSVIDEIKSEGGFERFLNADTSDAASISGNTGGDVLKTGITETSDLYNITKSKVAIPGSFGSQGLTQSLQSQYGTNFYSSLNNFFSPSSFSLNNAPTSFGFGGVGDLGPISNNVSGAGRFGQVSQFGGLTSVSAPSVPIDSTADFGSLGQVENFPRTYASFVPEDSPFNKFETLNAQGNRLTIEGVPRIDDFSFTSNPSPSALKGDLSNKIANLAFGLGDVSGTDSSIGEILKKTEEVPVIEPTEDGVRIPGLEEDDVPPTFREIITAVAKGDTEVAKELTGEAFRVAQKTVRGLFDGARSFFTQLAPGANAGENSAGGGEDSGDGIKIDPVRTSNLLESGFMQTLRNTALQALQQITSKLFGTGTESGTAAQTGSGVSGSSVQAPRLSCRTAVAMLEGHGTTTIGWSCFGSTASKGVGFVSGNVATGEAEVPLSDPGTASVTFGIECIASGSTVSKRSCEVPVIRPSVTAFANPKEIQSGEDAQLTWSSVETGNSCAIYAPGGVLVIRGGSSGTVPTPKITRSTQFAVVCNTIAPTPAVGFATVLVEGDNSEPLKATVPASAFSSTGATEQTTGGSQANTPNTGTFNATDDKGNTISLCDPAAGITKFTWCLMNNK